MPINDNTLIVSDQTQVEELQRAILAVLMKSARPLKARDIAKFLMADSSCSWLKENPTFVRSQVNSVLHRRQFKGQLWRQDSESNWALVRALR